MALSRKQKAKLAEAFGKIGKGLVEAAGKSKKPEKQNGNLSGCGGCATKKGK